MPIIPAELAFAGAGNPYSSIYDDVYHGVGDPLAHARHVFLGGNDLLGDQARWKKRERFAILETGFGLGNNFLATWQAWRADPQRPRQLHYFSIEKHPFQVADLARWHLQLPQDAELAELAAQLRTAWPSLVPGFHRLHFEAGQLSLTLIFGDARSATGSIDGRFDAFYLDGFAPAKNPEMWSQELIDHLAWLAAPGATLSTWTISGDLRRRLASADFHIERRPGYGFKREMLVANHPGNALAPSAPPSPGRIAVIGGGIAGIACAERLAARGCEVTLFDRRDRLAAETSGNRQAILLPVLAVDLTRLSRLNQEAFFYVLRKLQALADAGHPVTWQPCGVFQIARDADHARKQSAIVRDQMLPDDFVQFMAADTAESLVGARVAGSGWWFPQAGWLSPVSFAAALRDAAGPGLECRFGSDIAALEHAGGRWKLSGPDGTCHDYADTVLLAHAHGLHSLPQSAHLPLRCFRGQVTHLPAELLAGGPRSVVCREGYLAPPHDGFAGLGATFQRGRDLTTTLEDHASNLNRLAAMLPGWDGGFAPETLTGRVGLRPVSPDKLPMVGALPLPSCEPRPSAHVEWPRWPGLHVASGYGARGFVWAPLMGELLASQITGDPLPVENELAAAVDPARFAWKGIL